jgi:molecular chaperone GrpE
MVNKHDKNEHDDGIEFTNEIPDTIESELEDEDIEELSAAKVKKLRDALKEAEAQKRDALEALARERADFLNARKRLEEQKASDMERVTARHIEAILPLADSFEMAMQDPKWQSADEVWRKGVEGIYAQLTTILRAHGVEEIMPLGQEFNPIEHEALVDSGTNDIVAAVLQKGYRKGATIIRPAKVAVGTS